MKFPQNTKVKFRINGDETNVGTGRIVGIAKEGIPILGRHYIIEPDHDLNSEYYPYSHFVLPEIWFEPIE